MTESVDERLAQIQADVRELVDQTKQDDELAPEPTPEQPVDGKLALLQAGVRELVLQAKQDEVVATAQDFALKPGTLNESRCETIDTLAWSAQELEVGTAMAQGGAEAHSRQPSAALLAGTSEDSICTVGAPRRRRSSPGSCAAISASRAADDWATRRREQIEKAAARRQEGQYGELTLEHTFQPTRSPEKKTSPRTSMSSTPTRKTTPLRTIRTHGSNSCVVSKSPRREVDAAAAYAPDRRASTPRVAEGGSPSKPRVSRSSLHLQGTRSSSSRLMGSASPPAPSSIAMGHWRPPATLNDPSTRSLAAIAALTLRPQQPAFGQSPGGEDQCCSPDRDVVSSPVYQPSPAVLSSPGAQPGHVTKTTCQTPPGSSTIAAHHSPGCVTSWTHESPADLVANSVHHSPAAPHERFRPRSTSPESAALFPTTNPYSAIYSAVATILSSPEPEPFAVPTDDDMEQVMSSRSRQMEPQHAKTSRSPSFGAEADMAEPPRLSSPSRRLGPDMAEPPRLPSPSRRFIQSERTELARDLSPSGEPFPSKTLEPVILQSPSYDLTPSERISKALGSALQQTTFAERALAAAASSPRGNWEAAEQPNFGSEKVSSWHMVSGVWQKGQPEEVRRFSWDEIAPEHSDGFDDGQDEG